MISSLFAEWVDGLSAGLVWTETRLSQPRRFRLRSNSKSLNLFRIHNAVEEPVFSFNVQDFDRLPPNLLQQTRNSTMEIVVPAPAIVERRLDPLPAESLPFIDQVVLHQIETIFPWRASDILHSTRTEKRSDGMLDVFVQATSRSVISSELAVAHACNVSEVLVKTENQDRNRGNEGRILASIGSDKESKLIRARQIARFALIALIVLSLCLVGWTTYVRWSLSSEIAALDQAIADRRAIMKRSLATVSSGERDLGAKKKLTPTAVSVLEKLSSILPDDTYLTELNFEAGRVRISGVSSNAVELIPLLERSGQFKNVSFYAPTTRLSGGTSDRFSIEANLALQSSGSP